MKTCNDDLAVDDRPRHQIRHAKLSLDAGLRHAENDALEGVFDDVDIDALDHLRSQAVFGSEFQYRIDRLMREPAARIGLDANAVAQQRIGPAQLFDRLLVDRRIRMKHFVKAKARFDRFAVRGVTADCASLAASTPFRAPRPTCNGLVMVPKLATMPPAIDADDAERHFDLRGIEPKQLAACRGGAEGTQRARRVPAVMFAVAQRMNQFRRDFITTA